MNPRYVVLEMEGMNEVTLFSHQFFLWDAFSEYLSVLVEIQDRVLSRRLAVHPVVVCLINPNSTTLLFVGNLGLLDQSLNNLFDSSGLRNKKIILFLMPSQHSCMQKIYMSLTSLVMPSLSQVTLIPFLVSSSARLISRTSK